MSSYQPGLAAGRPSGPWSLLWPLPGTCSLCSACWVRRITGITRAQGGRQAHPVVLLHNQPGGNPATVRALPAIIGFFRRHHYRFVTR